MMINPYRIGRGPGYQQLPQVLHDWAPVEIMLLLGLRKQEEKERRKASEEAEEAEYGNVMISSEAVLKRRKEYFEKLMNKENDREPRPEEAEVVNEEVNCVSREEV